MLAGSETGLASVSVVSVRVFQTTICRMLNLALRVDFCVLRTKLSHTRSTVLSGTGEQSDDFPLHRLKLFIPERNGIGTRWIFMILYSKESPDRCQRLT